MPKDLYDVAREVTHAMGMTWTDPRTLRHYPPPAASPTSHATTIERIMRETFARQGAVHAHAQTLTCPECGSHQNQIMNLPARLEPFAWRCRMCRHAFVSGRE